MILRSKNIFNEVSGRMEPGFVDVEKGRIREIGFGKSSRPKSKSKVIDLGDLFVGPSGIDLHIHSRDFFERHKETFESLSAQAEKGGVAVMACMANTLPRLDSVSRLKEFFQKSKPFRTRFIPFGAVTLNLEGKQATDWNQMLKLPIAGLSDDGKPIQSEEMMEKVLRATQKAKRLLSLHEEDLAVSKGSNLHSSPTSVRLGIEGCPHDSESSMVERDLRIAKKWNASVHFGHLSSERSLQILRKERKAGVSFSAELTPHHGLLSVDEAEKFSTTDLSRFKVCPVIRSQEDRAALRKGLHEGLIDCFASDHAPHSRFEKECPMAVASHGMASLEFNFSLYNELRLQSKLPWKVFFRAFSARPAELLRLNGLGRLAKNFEANFIVFDPEAIEVFEFKRAISNNSPFLGRKLRGKVVQHYLKGERVFG